MSKKSIEFEKKKVSELKRAERAPFIYTINAALPRRDAVESHCLLFYCFLHKIMKSNYK